MIDIKIIFSILLISIILVLYLASTEYIKTQQKTTITDYFNGYWIGDKGFCDESKIKTALLYVEKKKRTNEFSAYFVVTDDTSDLINQIATVKLENKKYDLSTPYKNIYSANITFKEPTDIPENVTMEIDIIKGQLRLYSKGIMYGVFNKEHEVSNITQDIKLSI